MPDLIRRVRCEPADPAERTAARRHDLVAAVQVLARSGLGGATDDHVAVRDAERPRSFWVTPGVFDPWTLTVDDLELVRHADDGRGMWLPPDATGLDAAVRMWSAAVMAWSMTGRRLAALSQDASAFHGEHEVVDRRSWDPASVTSWTGKARLIVGAGAITYGRSVDEAAWWAVSLDRACRTEIYGRAAGAVRTLDPAVAALTQTQVGSHDGGWFNLQPLRSQRSERQRP